MGGVAAVLGAAMVLGSTLNVQAATIKEVFDASYYSDTYSDLAKVFAGNADALYEHYVTYGQKEGRVVVPFIDLKKYKEAYADLRLAFGDDWDAYLQHYLTYGVKEGRKAFGKAFDARAYADRYPDLKKAFGYDVLALYNHYIKYGKAEGRNAMPDAPKVVTSSNSNDSSSPSNPSTPSSPSNPSTPSSPSNPSTPSGPSNPNNPNQPSTSQMVTTTGSFKTADGEILANAKVTFTKVAEVEGMSLQAGGDVFTVNTDENGKFTIQLPAGRYTVTVEKEGYLTLKIEEFKVDPEEDAAIEIPEIEILSEAAAEEDITISGVALDEDGEPVSGVQVSVCKGWSNKNGSVVRTATTDAEGSYTLVLKGGYYTFTFAKDGYENSYSDDVTAKSGVEVNAEMVKTVGGDEPGGDVSGGDVSGGDVSGGDVSGDDVSGGDISGGDVSGDDVSGGDVSGGNSVSDNK